MNIPAAIKSLLKTAAEFENRLSIIRNLLKENDPQLTFTYGDLADRAIETAGTMGVTVSAALDTEIQHLARIRRVYGLDFGTGDDHTIYLTVGPILVEVTEAPKLSRVLQELTAYYPIMTEAAENSRRCFEPVVKKARSKEVKMKGRAAHGKRRYRNPQKYRKGRRNGRRRSDSGQAAAAR